MSAVKWRGDREEADAFVLVLFSTAGSFLFAFAQEVSLTLEIIVYS